MTTLESILVIEKTGKLSSACKEVLELFWIVYVDQLKIMDELLLEASELDFALSTYVSFILSTKDIKDDLHNRNKVSEKAIHLAFLKYGESLYDKDNHLFKFLSN